jgi:hypothetical protein
VNADVLPALAENAKAEHVEKTTVKPEDASKKKRSFAFAQHPKCVVCTKTAYPKESIALNDGQRVHFKCLKCERCGTKLNLKSYVSKYDKIFCRPCSKRPMEADKTEVGAQSNEMSQNTVARDLPAAEFREVRATQGAKNVFEEITSSAKAANEAEFKEQSKLYNTGKTIEIVNDVVPEEYVSTAEDVNFNGNSMLGRPDRITTLSDRQKRNFTTLIEYAKKNPNIKSLTLASCGLDNWCAQQVGDFIAQSQTVIFVNLDNNFISSAGIKAIAEGLQKNKSLRALTVQGQWKYTCSHDACEAMLEAFKHNDTVTQFGFTFVLPERQKLQNDWVARNNDKIRQLRKELRKKVAEIEHLLTVKFF